MTNDDEMLRLAQRLTDAQRRYLIELEPNRVEEDWQAQFRSRTHRKQLKRPGLETAHSLIRKGLVKPSPEPCECGWHYASLTELGLKVQAALRARISETKKDRDNG
jgi:hypothetical protein